jgi:hypothetical protein
MAGHKELRDKHEVVDEYEFGLNTARPENKQEPHLSTDNQRF